LNESVFVLTKNGKKVTYETGKEKDKVMEIVLKDIKVIGELISSPEKIKIFLKVHEQTKPNEHNYISGYRLSRSVSLSISAVYSFLEKMVNYGVFERPSQINDIKWVRITEYGNYIYEKIKSISPKLSEIL
jgi:predicted transcriptional regulator